MAIKGKLVAALRQFTRFLTNEGTEPTPWLRGLLDAEANRALEPWEWDDSVSPAYWDDYRAGVMAHKRHVSRRIAETGKT